MSFLGLYCDAKLGGLSVRSFLQAAAAAAALAVIAAAAAAAAAGSRSCMAQLRLTALQIYCDKHSNQGLRIQWASWCKSAKDALIGVCKMRARQALLFHGSIACRCEGLNDMQGGRFEGLNGMQGGLNDMQGGRLRGWRS